MALCLWFDYKTAQHYMWKEDCAFQMGHRVGIYVVSSVGEHRSSGLTGARYWRYETLIFLSPKDNRCEGDCCPTGLTAVCEPSELIACYWQSRHVAELMHYAIAQALRNRLLAARLYCRVEDGVRLVNPTLTELVTETVEREHLNEETDGEYMVSPRGDRDSC